MQDSGHPPTSEQGCRTRVWQILAAITLAATMASCRIETREPDVPRRERGYLERLVINARTVLTLQDGRAITGYFMGSDRDWVCLKDRQNTIEFVISKGEMRSAPKKPEDRIYRYIRISDIQEVEQAE